LGLKYPIALGKLMLDPGSWILDAGFWRKIGSRDQDPESACFLRQSLLKKLDINFKILADSKENP
jgi:hypothetical protein